MPTLDFKQITEKLNAEFAGNTRKIVFWYDDAGEFVDVIDNLELVGAKLHKLEQDNMFQTKYLLECHDAESSYLVYAPFQKPESRHNGLEDTWHYSIDFSVDLATIIVSDLGMPVNLKPVVQKYIKFFGDAKRRKRFYDYDIEYRKREDIEIAILSAICRTPTPSFEEVVRVVLTEGSLDENQYIADIEKYDLLTVFWQMCEDTFGYNAIDPSLMRLTLTLFVTYTTKQYHGEIPRAWKEFVSYKSGSIIAFLDNLMNNVLHKPQYDKLSEYISSVLNVSEVMSSVIPDDIIDCDAFTVFDRFILKWISERLLDEDVGAKLHGIGLTDICEIRAKKHFGPIFANHYEMLKAAHGIIRMAHYECPEAFSDIIEQYIKFDYVIDSNYRCFYTAFDSIEDSYDYETIRVLVENIYTNKYLNRLLPAWSAAIDGDNAIKSSITQTRFYNNYVQTAKDKTVVIISDALRYEVAQELLARLNNDQNCDATMKHIIAALPTYTQLGMAALLPHKELDIKADGKVLVDGLPSDNTQKREAILQTALPNSRCTYVKGPPPKREELRELITGRDAVYVYHDHIDATGSSSENKVFQACSEAVNEIYALIKRMSGSANVYRFIVTTDHGFLYKRDKFAESDKINLSGLSKDAIINRRFIIDENSICADGVAAIPIANVINSKDKRMVSWPIGANVFKVQGGLNFVHGGASPQEMILPLIMIKTERSHVETYPAKIALVSMVQKITNLITQLEFIQQEPVSDLVKPVKYSLYFVSEDNEKISTEQVYLADKKDEDSSKRIFRLRFNFKNKKYDSKQKYWLVVYNSDNGMELFRHQVIMDIAFADGIDFGF